MRLNSLNVCPPGGFKYWVAETKSWIPNQAERRGAGHLAMGDLLGEVRAHYRSNRVQEPTNLDLLIEDQMCRNLPGGWCNEGGIPVHSSRPSGLMLDFTALRQGTETLLRWVLTSGKYVEQKEADRRAAICAGCPNNQSAVGCTSCNMPAITNLVNQVRAGRVTNNDGALNACSICYCSLKAKVWLPIDVLRKSTPAEQMNLFPDFCWMKKD